MDVHHSFSKVSFLMFLLTTWTLCSVPVSAEGGGGVVEEAKVGQSPLEVIVTQLADRLGELEDSYKTLTGQLEEARAENAALKQMVENQPFRDELHNPVAFHAWLHNSTVVTTSGQLILGEVITNKGDSYNPASGVFTAPVSGTYLFLVTVGANAPSGKLATLTLMVQREIGAVATSSDLDHPDTNTNHVIVTLTRGDIVWLKAEADSGFYGNHWTSFSGVLLFES